MKQAVNESVMDSDSAIPAIKRFKTNSSEYIYDTNTNRVVKVDSSVYRAIEDIIHNKVDTKLNASHASSSDTNSKANAILDGFMKNYAMFKQFPLKYSKFSNRSLLQKVQANKSKRLILGLTEDCNMRCKYCIYDESSSLSFRAHGKKHMLLSEAKKAIDDFMLNRDSKALISFYGGEPLLEFQLIVAIVNYVIEYYSDIKTSYIVTTNGCLLTPKIVNFLYKHNFLVNISLDGPKHLHDKNRVNRSGNGTHGIIINAINYAYKCNQTKYYKYYGFQATIHPDQEPNEIIEYFSNNDLFANNTVTLNCMEVPIKGNLQSAENQIPSKSKYWNQLLQYIGEPLIDKIVSKKHRILINYYLPDIAMIHRRLAYPIDSDNHIRQNGCCIPGLSRIFVSTVGDYHICEKLGEQTYKIGDTKNGINCERVSECVKYYQEVSIEECRNCWAMHLCGLCYLSAYDRNKKEFNVENKIKSCRNERKNIEKSLIRIMEIYEINPKYMEEYVAKQSR